MMLMINILNARENSKEDEPVKLESYQLIGSGEDAQEVTGSAYVMDDSDFEKFEDTDIQSILRQVPGVSIQVEDGFGLRPNISIRGVVTERSSRITLLEDNVLIAPAPYSAPSAYYFPTAGRMSGIEVLKGPSAITQGPYTIGGAINMISTPIPNASEGRIQLEYGEDATTRVHGYYGNSYDNFAYLLEAHDWQSDGYQHIDFSDINTGLDKEDYMIKLRFMNSPDTSEIYQQFDIKFQQANESSNQSYLGLTDNDFDNDPFRRYGLSQLDNINTDHDQIIATYLIEFNDRISASATAYNNEHSRNWFKTEGIDIDGSINAQDFNRTGWFDVIQTINRGGENADYLQSILDGADSEQGAIQLRSNNRVYYSRGVQLRLDWSFSTQNISHDVEIGLRWHKDQEDRLQRNSSYSQLNGELVLQDIGLLGNAGNRIQRAEAVAFHVYDKIKYGNWIFTPGLRYENIRQSRIDYETNPEYTTDPSLRTIDNIKGVRENNTSVLLPGLGALYKWNDNISILGGVHKGFTAPTNSAGVREEQAYNYEFGFRYNQSMLRAEVIAFYSDYDNLLGVCTNSSGSDCEIGDAFNGDAARVYGLESNVNYQWDLESGWSVPVLMSHTYIKGEFQSDIADTDFFGDVSQGDSLPQIPENQLYAEVGLINQNWAFYLSGNYIDSSCVKASCGDFETTDSALFFNLSGRYYISSMISIYARLQNINNEDVVSGRLPYGARPYRGRNALVGFQMDF